jgi:hypothetical protein
MNSIHSGAVPGARVFSHLVSQLRALVVAFEPPVPEHALREERLDELREALRRYGPATAAELAARTGIPSQRIGGLLAPDVAAERVRSERDERTARHSHHPCLRYTLLARRRQA